ncbi:MAG: hypothetical protein K8R23_09475 [Chthoniobacter sp.]|nr:hypothetical protein [Chthoniobacter sp.]
MPFDPTLPQEHTEIDAVQMRAQLNALKALIDAVPAGPAGPAGATGATGATGPAGAPGTSGPLLLIQRKIGTVQSLNSGVALDPVVFDAATFAPLGAGGTFDGGTFTASVAGVFRFSCRLVFDAVSLPGPAPVSCSGAGTAPGVGDLLFGGMVNGAALSAGSGFGVISFSETTALTSGETYRLTAAQSTVPQMDITGGEVVIERLG